MALVDRMTFGTDTEVDTSQGINFRLIKGPDLNGSKTSLQS